MKTLLLLLLAADVSAAEASALQESPDGAAITTGLAQLRASATGAASETELFKIIEKDGKRFFELRVNQLEKNYLFSATMEKGTGERGVFSTMMEDTFVWYFHWAGDKVQFVRKSTGYRADPDTPEARAIERSFSDSIVLTLPMVSSDSEKGTMVFPADPFFLADLIGVQAGIGKGAYPAPGLHLSVEESTIEKIRSFPKNTEARVQLVFAGGPGGGTQVLGDARKIAVTMHYSLTLLPQSEGFQPRVADERVGYFSTTYNDFSRSDLKRRAEPAVTLIHRWNLEKQDPGAPISDVKKPITYWLDDAIPHEYRPAIRAGILSWNAAFEAVGFRGAIEVKEVDKDMPAAERADFDPANASYNMVRWFMADQAGFAIGPSRVNPMTGEIFNASVSLSDAMVRYGASELELAGVNPPVGTKHDHGECIIQMRAGLAALEAQGPVSEAEKKRYYDESLTALMAHEVGHNLGLRHNFKGSELQPNSELGKDGLVSSSVMDYLPANIAPKGKPQGVFQQTQVGPYDKWAIEYGYKPVSADPALRQDELAAIAARSATDASLAYGTDEDTSANDPDTQRFDLGRDNLAYAKQRVDLARSLWKQLETRAVGPAEGYASLRDSYRSGLGAFSNGVRSAVPSIGGIRVNRDRPGSGQAPYQAVPAAEQRAVLKFLDESVFSAEAFAVSPGLVARMGEERKGYAPTQPMAVASAALSVQKIALDALYSGRTLRGLETGASLAARPAEAMTAAEMMSTVRASIWKEVSAAPAPAIVPMRQALQREHLSRILGLSKSGGSVQSLARGDLGRLKRDLASALAKPNIQTATRLHLEDMQAQIKDALAPGAAVGR